MQLIEQNEAQGLVYHKTVLGDNAVYNGNVYQELNLVFMSYMRKIR